LVAQLVTVLKDALTEEKEMYKDLLSLSMQKKDILIKNDVAGLNTIVRRETEILRKIKTQAKYRTTMLEGFAKEAGLKERISFDTVIRELKGAERREMEALKEEFEGIVRDLKKRNELNNRLIETHLEYNAFCIGILTQGAPTGDTYGSTGRIQEEIKPRRGLIDQKI